MAWSCCSELVDIVWAFCHRGLHFDDRSREGNHFALCIDLSKLQHQRVLSRSTFCEGGWRGPKKMVKLADRIRTGILPSHTFWGVRLKPAPARGTGPQRSPGRHRPRPFGQPSVRTESPRGCPRGAQTMRLRPKPKNWGGSDCVGRKGGVTDPWAKRVYNGRESNRRTEKQTNKMFGPKDCARARVYHLHHWSFFVLI
jgi:hypothetical protein